MNIEKIDKMIATMERVARDQKNREMAKAQSYFDGYERACEEIGAMLGAKAREGGINE